MTDNQAKLNTLTRLYWTRHLEEKAKLEAEVFYYLDYLDCLDSNPSRMLILRDEPYGSFHADTFVEIPGPRPLKPLGELADYTKKTILVNNRNISVLMPKSMTKEDAVKRCLDILWQIVECNKTESTCDSWFDDDGGALRMEFWKTATERLHYYAGVEGAPIPKLGRRTYLRMKRHRYQKYCLNLIHHEAYQERLVADETLEGQMTYFDTLDDQNITNEPFTHLVHIREELDNLLDDELMDANFKEVPESSMDDFDGELLDGNYVEVT